MKQLILTIMFSLMFLVTQDIGAQDNTIFEQYQQILPRGRIAAIFEPMYIEADSAIINDNTWILGIIVADQPRAYSLNLMNHHEVVNDVIDSIHFAAVW
jgi:hypothetical protein